MGVGTGKISCHKCLLGVSGYDFRTLISHAKFQFFHNIFKEEGKKEKASYWFIEFANVNSLPAWHKYKSVLRFGIR